MPTLSRDGPRLLRTVGNKPYADDSTHEQPRRKATSSPLSSAPSDMPPEEDVYADPKSSDDEAMPEIRSKTFVTKAKALNNIHGNPRKKVADAKVEAGARRLQMPKSQKRKLSEEELDSVTDGPHWLSGSQDKKRSQGYGSSQTYSRKIQAPRKQLKQPKRLKSQDTLEAPKFKKHADFNLHADSSSQPEPTTATFKRPVFALTSEAPTATPPSSHPINSSPPLTASPPDSDEEVEEIEEIDMLPSSCPLCGATVDETFKLDWELEHAAGRRMNMKLQERFCQAHKERNAQHTWRDRAYPEVDWSGLAKRFKKHNARLQTIMEGKIHSTYRADLETKVRENKTRTAMHGLETGAERGASVGYYGSKGAKMMTEYILTAFSGKLRKLAAADRVIAAKGVSGGVSGYVQSVMVPELAVALVMEDCHVEAKEARQILLESADVGEALNAEEAEKVARASESPEPEYGLDSANTQKAMKRLEVLDD